jgi:hypothetical protein
MPWPLWRNWKRAVECHDSLFFTGPSGTGGSKRHHFLRLVVLAFFNGIVLIVLSGSTLWAAGALFFLFPIVALRAAAAAIYVVAVLILLVTIRPLWKGAAAVVTLFLLVLAWYCTIYPSTTGQWQPEVAETAWAKIDGDAVTITIFAISITEARPISFQTGRPRPSI